MTNRESQGPVQVYDATVMAINDALRQIQIRLDHLKGLNGRILAYDRHRVEDPLEGKDAINVDTGETDFVTIGSEQIITGRKTFTSPITFNAAVTVHGAFTATAGAQITLPVRFVDGSGNLIHAWGTAA